MTDPRFQPRAGRSNDAYSALSVAERDRRWKLTRKAMDDSGIDCLFIVGRGLNGVGNCRWLDNADYVERHLLFPCKGDPILCYELENFGKWYLETSWEGVQYRATFGSTSNAAAESISDLGYQNGMIGIVGLATGWSLEGVIPYLAFQNLKDLLPGARFCDASNLLMDLRVIKSAEEIAMIEKASEMSNVEINTMLSHARPGVQETELYAEAYYATLKAGNDVGGDYWTLLCSGKEEGYHVMRRPTNRILRNGDLIQVGHYNRFGGYWSHPHTAISLGPLDEEYKPMREAVYASTQRALEMLKPGTSWEDLSREMDKSILKRGYYYEICHAHNVGLDGNEPPRTAMTGGTIPSEASYRRKRFKGSIRDNKEWQQLMGDYDIGLSESVTVEAGMVIALEATACKEDRLYLEFGPQVVIEESGPRVLTPDACDVIEL